MDGALALDHATQLPLGSGVGGAARALLGTRVALDHVEALYEQPLVLAVDAEHATALATVLAGGHLYAIAGADLEVAAFAGGGLCHHRTSGASETIFMKLRSRSSRATGPKTRVPRGLFWSSMITAAFSSKAM